MFTIADILDRLGVDPLCLTVSDCETVDGFGGFVTRTKLNGFDQSGRPLSVVVRKRYRFNSEPRVRTTVRVNGRRAEVANCSASIGDIPTYV